MTRMRVLLSWSSGKDSAWALHTLRDQGTEVVGLLTTLNEETDR
ncbi:MAG: ATP-binding protein, partial [Actinomycetota bacterium]